jgi:hypothetical protein
MRLSKKRTEALIGAPHRSHYSCTIEDIRKIYKAGFEDGLDAGQCSYRLSQRLDKMQREGAQRCQKKKCHGNKRSKRKSKKM